MKWQIRHGKRFGNGNFRNYWIDECEIREGYNITLMGMGDQISLGWAPTVKMAKKHCNEIEAYLLKKYGLQTVTLPNTPEEWEKARALQKARKEQQVSQ